MKKYFSALIAVLFVGIFVFGGMKAVRDEHEQLYVQNRQMVARIAAKVVEGDLDQMVDVINAVGSRDDIAREVAAGDWQGGIDLVRYATSQIPDINRVTLLDMKGILRSDYPTTVGIHGQDFSFRDWYVGVTRTRKPYVSEVYRRAGIPSINVLSVATIIKHPTTREDLAILMMQVPASRVYGWSTAYDFGQGGTVQFIDRNGNVVEEAKEDVSAIVSVKSDAVVSRVMRGEVGYEKTVNAQGDAEYVAFAPVNNYGWSVVLRQPEDLALEHVRLNGKEWGSTVAFMSACLAVLFAMFFAARMSGKNGKS